MSELKRSYMQERSDGTHHEMSIRRSGSTIYLESLTVTGPTGTWRGETGALSSKTLGDLFRKLTGIRRETQQKGGLLEPFQLEVEVMYAAIVMREGVTGRPVYETSGDIATVTLYFRGQHMLDAFVNDLEGSLAWAA